MIKKTSKAAYNGLPRRLFIKHSLIDGCAKGFILLWLLSLFTDAEFRTELMFSAILTDDTQKRSLSCCFFYCIHVHGGFHFIMYTMLLFASKIMIVVSVKRQLIYSLLRSFVKKQPKYLHSIDLYQITWECSTIRLSYSTFCPSRKMFDYMSMTYAFI